MRGRAHRTVGHGFTLVELVLAVALSTILLGGMASVMMLTIRAMPGSGEAAGYSALAGRAARGLASTAEDLRYARSITLAGARELEFTVADRTGNGQPEVIRISWSGVAGEALMRKLNSGDARPIVSEVQSFQVATVVTERDGRQAVQAVEMTVRSGRGPAVTLRTTVQLLNGPTPP